MKQPPVAEKSSRPPLPEREKTPVPPQKKEPEKCDALSCRTIYELSDGVHTAEIETHLPRRNISNSSIEASNLETQANRNYWEIGKIDVVINKAKYGEPIDLLAHWKASDIATRWNKSIKIIAVGMASEEGDSTEEEKRACDRASTLRKWMEEAGVKIETLSLVLGQYQKNGSDRKLSNEQRPVALIRVIKKHENFNLEEALMRDLPQLPNWSIQLGNYSLGRSGELQLDSSTNCKK